MTALAVSLATACTQIAWAQQIPCPVDFNFVAPDGSFNAVSCEITGTGTLRPPIRGTFTNRGTPDNGVLTNNGSLGGTSNAFVTWINEVGATIENNNDWNFGAPASTTQNAGTINNNGLQSATVLENTGTLNNAGDWSETNGVLNTNAGDIFNSASGSMTLPRLENQLGGMIVNAGDLEVPVFNAAILGSSNAGEILNSGTFLSFMGPNALLTTLFNNTASFTNQSGGQATFVGGVENRGTMTNDAGATMIHDVGNGAAFGVLDGGQLDNAGTFESNSLFVVSGFDATVNNTGVFSHTLFDLRITNDGTLDNQPGATLNLSSWLKIGTFSVDPATLNNAGTLNVSGNGRMSVFAALNNASTGTMNMDSLNFSTVGGTLLNDGIVNLSSIILLIGTVANHAGATFDVDGTIGIVFYEHADASIENAGAVNLRGNGGIGSSGGLFGRYTQTEGSTTVDSLLAAIDIDFQGGELSGSGTVESNGLPIRIAAPAVVNPGSFTGALTMIGDVQLDGTSMTEVLGADDFDFLDVQGAIAFGPSSRIVIELDEGFEPIDGMQLTFLTAESVAQFDMVSIVINGLDPSFNGEVRLDEVTQDVSLHIAIGCPADITGNGVVDADDFFGFLDLFASGDSRADLDGNGVTDSADFFLYLDLFVLGCP